MKLPTWLSERYGNQPRLLEKVCPEVTDEILIYVAGADHEVDIEENLFELKRIRNGERWDEELEWIPREVLALSRWGRWAENVSLTKREFAVMQLFVSSALRQIGDHSETEGTLHLGNLVATINSCFVLGNPWMASLHGEMVRQLIEAQEIDGYEAVPGHIEGLDEMHWLFALYLLILLTDTEIGDDRLIELGELVATKGVEMTPTGCKSFIEGNTSYYGDFDLWRPLALLALDTGKPQGMAEFLLREVVETVRINYKFVPPVTREDTYLEKFQCLPAEVQKRIKLRIRKRIVFDIASMGE